MEKEGHETKNMMVSRAETSKKVDVLLDHPESNIALPIP